MSNRYLHREIEVTASRWFKNGDHPLDDCHLIHGPSGSFLSEGRIVRYFRHPGIDGQTYCRRCIDQPTDSDAYKKEGVHRMNDHGWIDGAGGARDFIVCPGDWIVTDKDHGYVIDVLSDAAFKRYYRSIEA